MALAKTQTREVTITPSGAALGADVSDFDISEIDAAGIEVIRKAWLDYLVLRVRGQDFGDAEHTRFAKLLGPLELAPKTMFTGKPWMAEFPEMSRITNIIVDGKPIGNLGSGECVWHTDMSYIEAPPCASLLHSFEIPPTGGETSFLNMYTAYETLPADLRKRIEGLSLKHSAVHSSDGTVRRGKEEPESNDVRDYPGAIHPIVRTHPETGRKALFLGRRPYAYITGLAVADSEELLDALWAHTVNPAFTWMHEWQVGDMIIWDNRCAMHRREEFDADSRRLMHRLVLKGDKPY